MTLTGAWVGGWVGRPAGRLAQRATSVGRSPRSAPRLRMAAKKKPPPNIRELDEEYREQVAFAERKYGRPMQVKKPDPAPRQGLAKESYASLKKDLFRDTLFLGGLGLAAAAGFGDRNFTASYLLGLATALLYVRLLTRGVDRVTPTSPSDSLAGARLAIVGLLVVVVGKHKDDWGTEVIPTLLGLATYKLATIWKLLTAGDIDPMFNCEQGTDSSKPATPSGSADG